MHPQPGPKPAHQQSEVNPPMSQKEHIKKKRAEERKQQELEELHVSMILKGCFYFYDSRPKLQVEKILKRNLTSRHCFHRA